MTKLMWLIKMFTESWETLQQERRIIKILCSQVFKCYFLQESQKLKVPTCHTSNDNNILRIMKLRYSDENECKHDFKILLKTNLNVG